MKRPSGEERQNKGEPDHAASPLPQAHIRSSQTKEMLSGLSRSDHNNEKAVRQQDGLLFQGRIVPTEFEKDHQNFLAKSYWPAKGSVKEFLENRYLCFQQLSNLINMPLRMTKNVISGLSFAVSSSFSATYRLA
jgi:hypothetical protein